MFQARQQMTRQMCLHKMVCKAKSNQNRLHQNTHLHGNKTKPNGILQITHTFRSSKSTDAGIA